MCITVKRILGNKKGRFHDLHGTWKRPFGRGGCLNGGGSCQHHPNIWFLLQKRLDFLRNQAFPMYLVEISGIEPLTSWMPWFQSALNTGNKFTNTHIPLGIQSLLVHYFFVQYIVFLLYSSQYSSQLFYLFKALRRSKKSRKWELNLKQWFKRSTGMPMESIIYASWDQFLLHEQLWKENTNDNTIP